MNFAETLSHYRERVNHTLKNAIETFKPIAPLLSDAMLYSTLNGGKRLRPILVYAVGQCFGQSCDKLDAVAAAIECIHCYSLIHDDLPAMDDDNLRRKKPTCHIVFGEATAILAGDALQTLAFELLSEKQVDLPPHILLRVIHVLAQQAGASGMGAGQSLDLLAEGKPITADALKNIHALKTGALIRASVLMGALGAGCEDKDTLTTLDHFGNCLGLAFQLQDDLFDVTGNTKNLGKNTGQDAKLQKATYAILWGVEATRQKINELMSEAIALLRSLPQDTSFLETLCDHLIHRQD